MVDTRPHHVPATKILWVDLEMTGLSPTDDPIMEMAAIITDWDFKEISTFEAIVKSDEKVIKKRMALNQSFWDTCPATQKSLLEQNCEGVPIGKADEQMVAWANKYFDDRLPILLAGNSIHNDRRFIASQMPKLESRLNYRMLDVSAWKVVMQGKFAKNFFKAETHRALEDIRGSIIELKYYLDVLKHVS